MTREQFMQKLRRASAQQGLSLDERFTQPFFVYYEELFAWNGRLNLIGRGQEDCFVERHLVDSLCALALHFKSNSVMLDLGSGNGLPGIPLAIALPGVRVDLLESNTRRCAFLQHVVSRLSLGNTLVRCGRFEDLLDTLGPFQYVLVRGVKVTRGMAEMIQQVLDHRGTLILFQGERQRVPDAPPSSIMTVQGVGGRRLIAIKNTVDFTALFDTRHGGATKREKGHF
jgi:16S rRNA (guanine527-N7)-methyltransferase